MQLRTTTTEEQRREEEATTASVAAASGTDPVLRALPAPPAGSGAVESGAAEPARCRTPRVVEAGCTLRDLLPPEADEPPATSPG